jgi:hypothetical protein
MNCMQRRVLQVFVKSGEHPNNLAQYAALWRYFQALVVTLPNRAGRVVDLMLRGDDRITSACVAPQLGVSEKAARLCGWRDMRIVEKAIRCLEWQQVPRCDAPPQRKVSDDKDEEARPCSSGDETETKAPSKA